MAHKYSNTDYDAEKMARAVALALPVSKKYAVEICSFIKNKTIAKAKNELGNVIEEKQAIPIKRFTNGAGHKTKIGPGAYPKKASKEIIRLLETVEANAQFKGLNTSDLVIKYISANQAAKAWHYGRNRGQMKRTNIEVVVEERKLKKEVKK